MGSDIFSYAEPFIILKSTNVITDKLKYNGSKGTAFTHDGKNVEQSGIDAIKEKLKEKLKYSALILENDYYKRIFSSLERENWNVWRKFLKKGF